MDLGRGVAQSGSAPAWGAGGRWFESSHPDHQDVLTSHIKSDLSGLPSIDTERND